MQNPYCQMCRKELCVVCKQKLDNCKCPCPNFVICRYCEVHEKTLPPCDDMFTGNGNTGSGNGGGGFGAGGPMGKMMMPLMMMMMMNANKQGGGGRSCNCEGRNRARKRDVDHSRRDRDSPNSGHPCCCKTAHSGQPMPMPMPNYPQPLMRPGNPCPQSCCTCSSRGDAHTEKCREPINQYFFGSDCNPQPAGYPTVQASTPPSGPKQASNPRTMPQQASNQPPQSYDDNWNRDPANQPQKMNQPDDARESPQPAPGKLRYGRHKPLSRKENSIVVNKV